MPRTHSINIGRFTLQGDIENNKVFLVKDDTEEVEVDIAELEEVLFAHWLFFYEMNGLVRKI